MKRHYTTTDLSVLRALSEPSWRTFGKQEGIPLMGIHASLCRLATDRLVELRWVDNALEARRLSWPAELSRMVAA